MTDEKPTCRMPCHSIEWMLNEVVRMRVALTQILKLDDKPGESLTLYSEAIKIAREALGTDER